MTTENNEKIVKVFYEKRRDICNSCEHQRVMIGIKTCMECGCAIWAKTLVRNTKCPLDKWDYYVE